MSESDRNLNVAQSIDNGFNILEIENYHLPIDIIEYLNQEAVDKSR